MAFNDLEKKRIENAEDKFQGIGSVEGLITPPVFRHYQWSPANQASAQSALPRQLGRLVFMELLLKPEHHLHQFVSLIGIDHGNHRKQSGYEIHLILVDQHLRQFVVGLRGFPHVSAQQIDVAKLATSVNIVGIASDVFPVGIQ